MPQFFARIMTLAAAALALQLFQTPQAQAVEGVRNLRPVLDGALFRGGGPGGKRPLGETGLQSLCEEGFSSAIYLYKEGFKGPQTISCITKDGRKNRMTYESMSFRKERHEILSRVLGAIMSGSGPVFVHCWNGMHAAGEISAVALRQFCGYSGGDAAQYWVKNIWDNPNDYKSIWQKHIPNFTPYEDLKVSSSLQSEICP